MESQYKLRHGVTIIYKESELKCMFSKAHVLKMNSFVKLKINFLDNLA